MNLRYDNRYIKDSKILTNSLLEQWKKNIKNPKTPLRIVNTIYNPTLCSYSAKDPSKKLTKHTPTLRIRDLCMNFAEVLWASSYPR